MRMRVVIYSNLYRLFLEQYPAIFSSIDGLSSTKALSRRLFLVQYPLLPGLFLVQYVLFLDDF